MCTNMQINELIQQLDRETMGHCVGMQNMAVDLENYFNYEGRILSTAALLCDVGKLYLSSYLLEKQDILTEFEKRLIDNHPYYSYEIIKDYDIDENIKSLVLYHHNHSSYKYIDNLPSYNDNLEKLYTTLELVDAYQGLIEYRTYRTSHCTPYDAYKILVRENCHNQDVLDYIKDNYIY